jgi:hypothetical protein
MKKLIVPTLLSLTWLIISTSGYLWILFSKSNFESTIETGYFDVSKTPSMDDLKKAEEYYKKVPKESLPVIADALKKTGDEEVKYFQKSKTFHAYATFSKRLFVFYLMCTLIPIVIIFSTRTKKHYN